MLYEIQQNKIDPIDYPNMLEHFNIKSGKVKGNWLQALAEAKINVKTHVKIKDTGTIRN